MAARTPSSFHRPLPAQVDRPPSPPGERDLATPPVELFHAVRGSPRPDCGRLAVAPRSRMCVETRPSWSACAVTVLWKQCGQLQERPVSGDCWATTLVALELDHVLIAVADLVA